ncbi:hypothetical protein THAOC_13799, partial [Thalassiosira oceanica]
MPRLCSRFDKEGNDGPLGPLPGTVSRATLAAARSPLASPHPSQDPGVPPPLAGLALARALHKTQRRPTEPKTRRRDRALQTEDFQQAETANPVPPSSRTPIGSVKNEWIWAEELNSRRGKPRSKRRFYLAFTLTKLSKDRASSVLGWTFFFAGFVAAAKMFCARASARLRPAPHTQYSLGGAGPNLTEVLGRVASPTYSPRSQGRGALAITATSATMATSCVPAVAAADVCANCGREGGDGVKLKNCTACLLVKYCGVDCQKAHRKQHKKLCK